MQMPPSNPRIAAQISSFQRFTLAKESFDNVAKVCKYIAENKPLDKNIFNALICGMATTYARPFLEAEGVGTLPRSFQKFDDVPQYTAYFTQVHSALIEGRHTAFAHRSPKQSAVLLQKHERSGFDKIRVRLHEDGQFTVSSHFLDWNSETLILVEGLAIHQWRRANDEMVSLMTHWKTLRDYPPGDYVLGETLPVAT